jgi:hypothetical protein
MTGRDWQIFFASWLIGNGWWALACYGGVEAVTASLQLFVQIIQQDVGEQGGIPRLSGQVWNFGDMCRLFSVVLPRMWFLFIGVAFCFRLPPDSASRLTPLPFS